MLLKLRDDVKPQQRRDVHQKRVAQQQLDWLGVRSGRVFFFPGFVVGESQLNEFGHQKHNRDNSAHNVRVAVHSEGLLKYILIQNETFGLFYELRNRRVQLLLFSPNIV